jgi:pimeloyl-ACP methyl ester carboxylesterase
LPSSYSTQPADSGRLISAGDHRIRLYEEGTGPSVVVIVAGAGDCADSWVPIRRQLGASHRVASYDRAGIGGSDARAAANIKRYLAELDAVIDAVSPRSPVTLVGHSLGGLIAWLYQHARPGRIDGLILLDSTPERPAIGESGLDSPLQASRRGCSSCSPRSGLSAFFSGRRRCLCTLSSRFTRPLSHRRSTSAGWRWCAPASAGPLAMSCDLSSQRHHRQRISSPATASIYR